jgi:hypothetical protein
MFSPGTPVSSTNKIDRHNDMKVALNTIAITVGFTTTYPISAYYH